MAQTRVGVRPRPTPLVPTSLGFNYGYEFDGVDEYITISNPVTISGDYSFSIWFKTTIGDANRYILASSVGGYAINMNWGDLQVTSSNNSFDMIGLTGYNNGEWHNVVYTYNRTSGSFKCYIDAVLVKSQTATAGVDFPVFNKIGSNGLSTKFYKGRLDDYQLYDSELNLAAIQSIYNSGYVTAPTALPVQHLKLGESDTWDGSNWTVVDEQGGLNGTSVNMEEADRKLGVAYSMNFDGVDEQLITNNMIGTPSQISYSVWVKFNSLSNTQDLMSNRISSNNGTALFTYINNLIFQLGDSTNDSFFNSRISLSELNTNEWYHLVGSYNGIDSKIYINSVLKNTWNAPSLNITAGNNSFSIGRRPDNNSSYFTGNLMFASVFNYGLSQSEVDILYNSGKSILTSDTNLTPPISEWKLGGDQDVFDGTNWIIKDLISNNDLVSSNMEEADKTSETP